ncbi:dihydrodipicolinate synthase family protein [Rhizobium sp. RCAM05350]|nr:dihydrodipicolinate synthase family protein [Rhizobium sp. RCAM05350]
MTKPLSPTSPNGRSTAASRVCSFPGPAGEPWALTDDERTRLIRLAVAVAGNRVPVFAGTGTNCTETTIARTAEAKNMGASAAYVVTPYYSKPAQEGLFRHYRSDR